MPYYKGCTYADSLQDNARQRRITYYASEINNINIIVRRGILMSFAPYYYEDCFRTRFYHLCSYYYSLVTKR